MNKNIQHTNDLTSILFKFGNLQLFIWEWTGGREAAMWLFWNEARSREPRFPMLKCGIGAPPSKGALVVELNCSMNSPGDSWVPLNKLTFTSEYIKLS